MKRFVTLLTDFGTSDGYVGALKGTILSVSPDIALVDITHDVAAQDIAAAAFALGNCWRWFPEGTVHVIVVDPGVGTARRPLAVCADGQYLVAPDNGVLTHVLRAARVWQAHHLVEMRFWQSQVSHTFHGRDIFGPVGAHLALGVPLQEMGPQVHDLVELDWPPVQSGEGRVVGHVQHIDHFGNIISDIDPASVPASRWLAAVGALQHVASGKTYGDVAPGDPVSLIGSHGYVEVGLSMGHAAQRARARVGMPFVITPRG